MSEDHQGIMADIKLGWKMIQEINMIFFWPETDLELVLNDLVRNHSVKKYPTKIKVSTAEI